MPHTPLAVIVHHIRDLAGGPLPGAGEDARLLARFVRTGEEAAFTILVQRHGPMVLDVCRRVLRHTQDAEDAFQATFLLLARKAGSIRKGESVGCWLHGVACRTAAKARARAARRRECEREAAEMQTAGPRCEKAWQQLLAVLDEEIQRLPRKHRTPVVLCYLEGKTQEEAARQLGWPLGTVRGRLARAREQLRGRLARRGLALTAGPLAAVLAANAAPAALPARLLGPTVKAALRFAAGSPAAGAVSTPAAALAESGCKALAGAKLKLVAVLLLAAGTLAAGGLLARQTTEEAGTPALLGRADTNPTRPRRDSPRMVILGEPAGIAVKPKEAAPEALKAAARERDTEAAVYRGLQWLAGCQQEEGNWTLDADHRNDTAATAFGLLPFLDAGETHQGVGRLHPYAGNVEGGLRWLLRVQKADGNLGGDMYSHALATRALCRAYRLTSDPTLKRPAQQALDYIVRAQHEGGGWRYTPGQAGDTSVTVWQLLALDEGRQAGLVVPADTRKRAGTFLDSVAAPRGGYAYVPGAPATSISMAAAGLLSRLSLGQDPRHAQALRSAGLLAKNPPGAGPAADFYYYHFATLALERVGGQEWDSWQPPMRRLVLQRQEREGGPNVRGGWDPSGQTFRSAGGRIMYTSLSLSILQACARRDSLRRVEARERSEKELKDLLGALGDEDFWLAREAMRALIAVPDQAVPLVKAALRPAPPVEAARLARLIADLDADDFAVREKASADLEKLGLLARPALERAGRDSPSVEVKGRVARLLAAIAANVTAEDRRTLRAVEVLVQAGTPQARELLRTLAGGDPEAPLTREAKAGLERLTVKKTP
jgi:RNA polymerase sigma factor (sigma-70 family)